jgi:tRNA threonylcarbamoyl adenosine modification protein (Sua5/YciO/YrdC/YwlC family)
MSQFFQIHPENPQLRLIRNAVEIIKQGGVVIYPTDSCYALGCQIGDKKAVDRIRQIRKLDDKHNFTLMCRDMAEMSDYAMIDNIAYRLIKSHTPGPYTFVLPAMKSVPRRLLHPKRKTIGLGNQVDLVIDGGYCGLEPTSVIEILEDMPQLVRRGKGAEEMIL